MGIFHRNKICLALTVPLENRDKARSLPPSESELSFALHCPACMHPSLLLLTGWLTLGAPGEHKPEVQLEVGAACGTSEELFSILAREHQLSPTELTFERVIIAPDGDQFRLDWSDAQGMRTLRDPDCRTLFRSLIVMAVASVRAQRLENPAPEPAPSAPEPPPEEALPPPATTSAETAPPLVPETPRAARTRSPRRSIPDAPAERDRGGRTPLPIDGEGALGIGGAASLFPNPAFFAELSGTVLLGPGGLSLALRYFPPSSSTLTGSVGVQLDAWAGRFGVLFEPIPSLRADLGFSATYLLGEGLGIRNPSRDGVWLLAPELDLSAQVLRKGIWGLDVGLRGWVAGNSPRFEIDGEGEIYRTPPAGAALFLKGKIQSR